jgi:ureidoacrylate peracid hydrolase
MNGLEIPASVTERVVARCGVMHPHADLDPTHTALVVIDLQNAFMHDDIGHAVCPAARDIVPEVNRLAATVRATGGGVSGSRIATTSAPQSSGAIWTRW